MNLRKLFGLGEKNKNEIFSDELAKELGFNEDVLEIIKQFTTDCIQPLKITDLYNENKKTIVGIFFTTLEERAEKSLEEIQSQIKQLGYLAFISDRNFNQGSKCKIGLIKGNDQFEILKVLQTNGENYDISNDDVISKLKQWNNLYPFIIIGADFDWIEAKFTLLPSNKEIKSFAKEMLEFCPDVVEQDKGSIEELIDEIKKTKKLFLWWD